MIKVRINNREKAQKEGRGTCRAAGRDRMRALPCSPSLKKKPLTCAHIRPALRGVDYGQYVTINNRRAYLILSVWYPFIRSGGFLPSLYLLLLYLPHSYSFLLSFLSPLASLPEWVEGKKRGRMLVGCCGPRCRSAGLAVARQSSPYVSTFVPTLSTFHAQ